MENELLKPKKRGRWWLKVLGVVLVAAAIAQVAAATVQRPERLIYEGREFALLSTPLESLLSTLGKRPDFGPGRSSALQRGYVGTWEIKDGSLHLVGLARVNNEPIDLSTILPGLGGETKASFRGASLRCQRPPFPG